MLRDFRFAQRKRRDKYGEQIPPQDIIGLYNLLTDISVDAQWTMDAAWRRDNDHPYLSWEDFEIGDKEISDEEIDAVKEQRLPLPGEDIYKVLYNDEVNFPFNMIHTFFSTNGLMKAGEMEDSPEEVKNIYNNNLL